MLTFPFSFWKTSAGTTYFGNCQSDGTPPAGYGTTFYGAITFYGTQAVSPSIAQKAMEFTCPGSGAQTLNSMEFYGYQRSAGGHIRMSIYTYASTSADGGTIYDYTLNKVCDHTASTSVNAGTSGSPQWFGLAAGLTGTTTLTGGHRYIVATALDSANVGVAYTTSTNAITQISADYTGGMPDPLTGGSVNNSGAPVIRLSITGNRTSASVPTQEVFYVDTDFAGTSNGGPTAQYKFLQDAIVARCNKTFTLPIYIYCSGSANDTKAVIDSALGQMVTSSTNQLYIVGDRTATTWDSSKHKLIPTDRTSYYGVINPTKNYVNFDRMQVYLPSATAGFANEAVYISGTNTGVFSNSIVRLPGSSETERYFSSINGIKLFNVIMYGMGSGASSNGIKNHGASSFYSCTIIGGSGNGIDVAVDGTATVKNCYIYSAGVTIAEVVGGSTTLTTTATSDALGSTGLQNIAVNTTNFTNVTAGSENWALPSGSALIGVGTDTSGDASPFNFTTDINGATRSGTWDIGADEF